MSKSITITTNLATLADRLGNDISDYGTFPSRTEVTIHANGQALALDGGQAVELESDSSAVQRAFCDELEAAMWRASHFAEESVLRDI